MSAVQLNPELFHSRVIEGAEPALVEFWAPWCVYCRRIAPAVQKLSEEYDGSLLVGQVNIDEYPDLADQYQVEVIPTLIHFQAGQPVGRIVAPDSKAKIQAFVQEHQAQ